MYEQSFSLTPAQSWLLILSLFIVVLSVVYLGSKIFGLGAPLHTTSTNQSDNALGPAQVTNITTRTYRPNQQTVFAQDDGLSIPVVHLIEDNTTADAHYLDAWKGVLK